MRTSRSFDMLVLAAIVVATLTTGAIHYTFGGMMFLLNSIGYLTFAVLVIAPLGFLRRTRSLVLIALALYTMVTIGGWVVMGGRFPLAYFTKGVELVLLALIAIHVARHRAEIAPAFRYLRGLLVRRGETQAPAAGSADK